MTKANFQLSGPDVEVAYDAATGALFVRGQNLLDLEQGATFEADRVTRSDLDGAGQMLQVVLLASSRAGVRTTLSVLLPQVDEDRADVAESDVTGAAVLVDDYREVVGGPPAVLQQYDVRPLRGKLRTGP